MIQARVPDIGDLKDVPVIEVFVKPGDVVVPGDPLVLLESDKATVEVPAEAAGTVAEVLVAVGDVVNTDTVLLRMESAEAPAEPVAVASPPDSARDAAASTDGDGAEDARDVAGKPPVHASPLARSHARELGVDIREVAGTGPNGRVQRADVQRHVRERMVVSASAAPASSNLPAWPQVDHGRFGEVERVAMSRIRRIAGPNLARNWVTIPHVTNFAEADVTTLEAFRRELNAEAGGTVKVTLLAFAMKISARALRAYPEFNASLDGGDLILKKYVHIGFAVDTPKGLVIPVIRDVDRKGVLDLAGEIADLSARARAGMVPPDAMQGGCFTISSLGGIEGLGFTPIINAPELAILGMARARTAPVWDGEEFQPRLMLPLALSWDHRAVDGAAAGRFLAEIAALFTDFRRVSL